MTDYDPNRRHARGYRRARRPGVEHFEVDDVEREPLAQEEREQADDQRILSELPPHWAVFNERE